MRALRLGLKLLAATLLTVLALAGALWLWSGTDSSLATLLIRLQRFLPADQTLEAKDVRGSVQGGGHIGWLRWQRGDLSVEAQDIGVRWTLGPFFNKQLRLSELTVASLKIDDRSTRTDKTPPSPPTGLTLPITIDVPFKVASITWTGTTTLDATEVTGHYIFNSYSHKLHKGYGRISSGKYQFSGELQATAPMVLTLQVNGQILTQVPSSQTPLTVTATARLAGQLAGPQAMLTLQATLTPELSAVPAPRAGKSEAMQATVSAQIAPWQTQPLTQAHAKWQALNLAALWPQTPQTQLTGDASVTPAGTGWQGKVNLSNTLPGPWNQQRLPLTTLQAIVAYDHAQWTLSSVRAAGAGGSLTGAGQFNVGLWAGQASLQGVNPGAVDTRLANASLSGQLQAEQSTSGIRFNAQLDADPSKTRAIKTGPVQKSLQALEIKSLQAQGQWTAPLLTLSSLRIDAPDARLEGKLTYQTVNQATQGQLTLSLPGLNAAVDGHLASTAGQGGLTLNVADAARATRWLSRFPTVANTLQAARIEGAAELAANWQGGWQNQGRNLKIEATLRAPKLDWASAPAAAVTDPAVWHLRDLQANLSGTLAALQVRTQGQAKTGMRQFDWLAQVSAGQRESNHWQGTLIKFKLSTQDTTTPSPWSLQLADDTPVALDWLQGGDTQTVSFASGQATLTGPQASTTGAATLSWHPVSWSRRAPQNPASPATTRWQSKGSLTGLPLAWVDALGLKSMADLGLGSNMLMDGQWDAAQTETLTLKASLARRSGDLSIRTGESRQQTQSAGVREAQLGFLINAGDLSASLRWASARAGQATVDLRTRLQSTGGTWVWANDAPVSGTLQMQMPPIDAWSALAPPGWRLRGTLDANAALSGTRKQPQWRGTLLAKDLAVRSVADGIDFQQGTLSARLVGQQLHIDDFTLFGAGGAAGGHVKVTGMAEWLTDTKPTATLAQHVQIALEADARALRLSTRSDRRLTVSGHLSAHLKNNQLALRGKLTADQAMLTLPSETTPVLGDDVVVRPSATMALSDASRQPGPATKAVTGSDPTDPFTPDIQVTLDLGQNFQVRGRGLETRLAGTLELQAAGTEKPGLTGTIRTASGTYQAYGQRMDIEQGVLQFFGPANNPALNILAIRPKTTHRVGVQVLGTALLPFVRLYAEPELPEAEKLSWLVLGRSTSGSGGEAALLQQAALALLGGDGQGPSASLTQALGLDELSFRGSGSDTTRGATVTLGKRLGNDFYVAYESGLTGTLGVFTIFYDLSRSLTLRAQTGEQSAIDLIWTHRYD